MKGNNKVMSSELLFGSIFVLIGVIFLAIGAAIRVKETDGFFARFIKSIFKILFILIGAAALFITARACA